MPFTATDEERRERRLLDTPLGEKGSGRVRYAAAMYLHGRGLMGNAELEAYRICAKDDAADPRSVLESGA